ncbi:MULTISPECIES: hypothetical protein [Novosphingobium]|uniref:Uncharacterized protein n=1 Tax=Novosphingobium pentaromativorans US6-1 TaxID=1088721 RepID=G6EIM1_9SPHN|nr:MULTISPECIES: hypothetical protein [Novosphingobium]AIT78837.1 hypothetical protein JI59_02920 [Novosphingobium pentaromativorans US6-1]EHJ58963.1 hypothetical protein NSU_4192 [Novosphingobium pentaromativorans US6-1]GFM30791.1 uncharacterized protein PY1_contig-13-54 [Novosphingobium sp. PY1]CCA93514.1 conserved hypothetical protein [Novosphingobium sp. PP1Y]
MKFNTLELTRVWAAVTGLVLAVCYFGALYLDTAPSPLLAMLVTAIGGFEMFLFGQDQWLKRRGKHG